MANWIYNPADFENKVFDVPAAGDYTLHILDVVEKTFRSGNAGYEITFGINGYNGRIWFNFVLDENKPAQTNQRIGAFFDSFGITSHELGNGRQWIGCVGAGRVIIEEYAGKKYPKVAYFIPRKSQGELFNDDCPF